MADLKLGVAYVQLEGGDERARQRRRSQQWDGVTRMMDLLPYRDSPLVGFIIALVARGSDAKTAVLKQIPLFADCSGRELAATLLISGTQCTLVAMWFDMESNGHLR